MKPALLLLGSYLLGSISFGYWIVRVVNGLDIRRLGSGNPGATNVLRTAGRLPGLAVLLGDLLKGVFAIWLARFFGFSPVWVAGAGAAAVLGHVFPAYLGFRGGKGVATAAGVFLALSLPIMLLVMALFVAVVARTRQVSLGSIVGAVSFPLLWLAFCGRRWTECPQPEVLLVVAFIALVVVARHTGNIRRLIAGTERRLGGGSSGVGESLETKERSELE